MRTLLSILIITMISVCSFGQKYPKFYDAYKAKNGHEFKVGDNIYLTEPSNFKEEFSYIFNNKALTSKTNALYIYTSTSTGEKTIYNRRYRKYPIRYFINHPNGFTVAALEINSLFNFFIDIDNAILYDEIANCNNIYFESSWGEKNFLTDSIAYLLYITKEPEITKELAKEYLYLFNRSKYNLIREDEFEFHKGIKETQNQLNEIISQIDTNIIYTILFDDFVDNYNFDLEAFPIKWKHNGMQVYNDIWEGLTPNDVNNDGVKLTDLRIKFINTDNYNTMPLDIDKANSFVKYKKDDNGNVDRKIFMKINFKIVGLANGVEITQNYFKGEKYLHSEIKSIDFYANDSEKYIEFYHFWLNRLEK